MVLLVPSLSLLYLFFRLFYLFLIFWGLFFRLVFNLYCSTAALQCYGSFLPNSKVNQLYVGIHPPLFEFSSCLGHHKALSRVLCACFVAAFCPKAIQNLSGRSHCLVHLELRTCALSEMHLFFFQQSIFGIQGLSVEFNFPDSLCSS